MYRRRRRRRAALPLLAGLLTLSVLGGTARAVPPLSLPRAAVYLSSLLCAPGTALDAARRTLDEAMEASAPAAPEPERAAARPEDAAFWTDGAAARPAQPESPGAGQASDAAPQPDSAPASAGADEPVPDGMAPLLETHYAQGSGAGYLSCGSASIRNCTELPDSELAAEMGQPLPFAIEPGSDAPQVLIMHTHATETYELEEHSWCDPAFSARSTDLSRNMAAVGEELAAQLNAAGIVTLHDTTLHDYPSYNGSYAKSNATVRAYLEQYPSIKVVLDVHRDAIQRGDGTRIKPVAVIDGKKCAQVMIICGADVNGNLPHFRQNLRFAARWQDKMEAMFPGLTRPVLFDYRYYNQDLTTGSLLIEVGGHANTLDEAKYAGQLVGRALAALLTEG